VANVMTISDGSVSEEPEPIESLDRIIDRIRAHSVEASSIRQPGSGS